MHFSETQLKGAFIVEIDRREDARGFFARAWCKEEFEKHGLDSIFVQSNIAFSKRMGTLRGLHYQVAPCEETKLVRCTRGAIYDVIVDLRPGSCTYKQWIATELTADNYRMVYVPKGLAHGYQTLVDETEVFYEVSYGYSSRRERGVRWDDPMFAIRWPETDPQIISDKDRRWPDYVP